MFNKKEISAIIIAIVIFIFIILFPNINQNPLILLIPPIIIFTSIISKKISAEYVALKIEHKTWEFQRFGIYKRAKFKKPYPIGLILPLLLSFFSLGLIKPFTLLQFNYKDNPQKRLLKKSGRKRKMLINETDPAFVSTMGFLSILLLAIISILIAIITDLRIFALLTKYSIYYGAWNLIPISQLDGTKLFFGNAFIWFLLTGIYLISLGFVIMI